MISVKRYRLIMGWGWSMCLAVVWENVTNPWVAGAIFAVSFIGFLAITGGLSD